MLKCKFYHRQCNHCGQCMFAVVVNGQQNTKRDHSAYKRSKKRNSKNKTNTEVKNAELP